MFSKRTDNQLFFSNIFKKVKQFYGWHVNYICQVNPYLILDVSSSVVLRNKHSTWFDTALSSSLE